MQTGQEVVDNILRRKKPDRVGLFDNPWGDTMRKWVTQGYPTNEDNKPIGATEHFGFDFSGMAGFEWIAKPGVSELLEETDEWRVTRDGNGAAFKNWKNKSGTPQHIDFLMTSREVWERDYKPHLVGSARDRLPPEKLEQIKADIERGHAAGRSVMAGLRGIWENMRAAFGDICLYESMLLDPDWIKDYCRTYTDLYKEGCTIIFEEAGKPDNVWVYDDLGYKLATFCSPELYGELIFPFYDELMDFLHSYDIPAVLHTCGYTEPVMHLITGVGFDGVNPMEVKAGNDPLRMADEWGDKIAFIGGLDARVLESGDRDYIEKEVTALVEGMKKRGAGYVFGSDHSLSTLIDYEDFLFAIDVYKKHCHY